MSSHTSTICPACGVRLWLTSREGLRGRQYTHDWTRARWGERTDREVRAALPVSAGCTSELAFEGLSWRQLRLQHDQRLTEWAGHAAGP